MKKRLVIPIVFGVIGTATLLWLGLWQVERLAWKEAILADISARIVADPVALPANPDPEADRYLPVKATGELTGEEVIVLASVKQIGAVHRLISVLETEGRRVLVDRGYVPIELNPAPQTGPLEVLGNRNRTLVRTRCACDGQTPENRTDPDRCPPSVGL